jgi:hypothetical protein
LKGLLKIGMHGSESIDTGLNKWFIAHGFEIVGMPDGLCTNLERLTIRAAFDFNQIFIVVLKQRDSNFRVRYNGDGSQWACGNE